MNHIKAFVVGVSDYKAVGAKDLSFCKSDMLNFSQAIKVGMHVKEKEVVRLGLLNNGVVSEAEFWKELQSFNAKLDHHDTAIFYFSGHGTSTNPHYLVLSDGFVETQKLIEVLSQSKAKNKILFLDCCYSGNFSIKMSSKIDISDSIDKFNGTGYAILTSSNAYEPSYGDRIGSVFTNILCNALTNKFLIREGAISLQDLQLWVKRALEIYTRNNPNSPQHAIFRADMGGTIFFHTGDFKPYPREHYYIEKNEFIIHSVDPVHIGSIKRYAAKVILKSIPTDEELANWAAQISELLKNADVYNSERQRLMFKGQETNIVWVYFGFSEEDIINGNFYCIATWVDEKQSKEWWHRLSSEHEYIINDIHLKKVPFYNMLKEFINENSISDMEVFEQIKQIRFEMINIAEHIIFSFNELCNHILSEDELFDIITPLCPRLDELFLTLTDIGFSSTKIKDYREAHLSLLGTIHDFSYFYNKKYKDQRDPANRKSVMQITISRYHTDLKKLEQLDKDF
ncbi:caspase family protein [Cohnella zeiphila]|uniref:Caspase family protein n=1 Tax=Cohnella zeiphila TaxID=2761120 RepID=A0A7X0SK19_9BACL|nr:caspase family protein [Cohnella zeiphila]MBB6731402.1 caspase family protein [Cohnella zeiphila]